MHRFKIGDVAVLKAAIEHAKLVAAGNQLQREKRERALGALPDDERKWARRVVEEASRNDGFAHPGTAYTIVERITEECAGGTQYHYITQPRVDGGVLWCPDHLFEPIEKWWELTGQEGE